MTHWEELCAVIRGLRDAADNGHMSIEDFAEYAMGAASEACDIMDTMGPVAREQPSVWRIDLERHGLIFYVGTSDEARRFWHGRAYGLGIIGGIKRHRGVSEPEHERHDEAGGYELVQPT